MNCQHPIVKIVFEYEDPDQGRVNWCAVCGAWRWVYPNDPTGNEQPWHLANEKAMLENVACKHPPEMVTTTMVNDVTIETCVCGLSRRDDPNWRDPVFGYTAKELGFGVKAKKKKP